MGTEMAMNVERPRPRRRKSVVYVLRLAAVLTLTTFVVMATLIVFSDPISRSEGLFIQSIEPGSPADLAGVEGILTEVNGKPITTFRDLQEDIYNSLGEPMIWTLKSNNSVRQVELTPLERPESGQSATGVIQSQNLTRPIGRSSRIIAIGYIAYIGVAILGLAELIAWRRRRIASTESE